MYKCIKLKKVSGCKENRKINSGALVIFKRVINSNI